MLRYFSFIPNYNIVPYELLLQVDLHTAAIPYRFDNPISVGAHNPTKIPRDLSVLVVYRKIEATTDASDAAKKYCDLVVFVIIML